MQNVHKPKPNLPHFAGAGTGAVHPAVLLVRVLRHPLSAVVEGRLDAAHAGGRVQGGLRRAEARVVAQPGARQGSRGCTRCASTSATADAYYRLCGGGGGVRGTC